MSGTLRSAVGAALLLILAACSGGTTASPAPASQAPSGDASASGSPAACAPSTDAGTVSARIADFAFSPSTITAKVGDVISWTNDDTTPHTATVKSDATCTTEDLANGASGGIVFDIAGSYDYFCKIHPTMTGKIEVS